MSVAAATAYYDFGQLASLKGQAAAAPDEALSNVASQFESLFLQMMLKSMRDATPKSELFGSSQMDLYQSMLDQQVSLQLSAQGGLGLADILVQQLDSSASATGAEEAGAGVTSLAAYSARVRAQLPASEGVAPLAVQAPAATATAPAERSGWNPRSIAEFASDVWDDAVNAAKELGLDPLVLVAQSALETGWGKRVINAIDGGSSFNLFGIKTGRDWTGAQATVETLEYRDGIAEKERASFRVYDSIAGSFADYVSFLKNNPRYQEALDKVDDSRAFVEGLQEAGYATDPNYAKKIINIMNSPALKSALAALKN